MMQLKSLGPYDLKEAIGHGGMGSVFLGINRDTQQRVAIKVLAPAYAADPGFRERFESEIHSLEKLKHPHVVELYGYGEENGTLYYAMELVEGSNLQKELSAGCRFSWRETIDIAVAICGALKQAHDHGIIHRDIKPANLLLTESGQVKLSDFGIAKLFGNTQITADGGVLGTADYMAPEQAEGIGATIRSDLYSVGSVMYALLASRPPFKGKSMAEVVHKVRYDEPTPLRHYAPDTPEELAAVIHKLLSKNTNDRVPTARALSNRLRAIKHALSLHGTEDEPGLLDMGPDKTASAPTRDDDPWSDEEFANLETAVEMAPHPEDVGEVQKLDPTIDDSQHRVKNGTHSKTAEASDSEAAEVSSEDPSEQTHFTPVDDEHRRRRLLPDDTPDEAIWSRVISVLGIVAMLGALFFVTWKLRQPLTADQLYEKISPLQDKGSDAMVRGEDDVVDFLERFPNDPRFDEVTGIRANIDLERLSRQLSTRARNTNRPLAPVEQALVEAIRKEALNPVTARQELQAIIDVFSTDPDASAIEKRCILLARRNLNALNTRLDKSSATYVEVIQSRLESAIELKKTDPVEAQKMISGIITLYTGKPWAEDIVLHAREELQTE